MNRKLNLLLTIYTFLRVLKFIYHIYIQANGGKFKLGFERSCRFIGKKRKLKSIIKLINNFLLPLITPRNLRPIKNTGTGSSWINHRESKLAHKTKLPPSKGNRPSNFCTVPRRGFPPPALHALHFEEGRVVIVIYRRERHSGVIIEVVERINRIQPSCTLGSATWLEQTHNCISDGQRKCWIDERLERPEASRRFRRRRIEVSSKKVDRADFSARWRKLIVAFISILIGGFLQRSRDWER